MGIWIRTQDKKSLIETDCIELGKLKNGTYELLANFHIDLGYYSSKEKALKVLEAIEERIALLELLKLGFKTACFNTDIIFKIPKDDDI